MPEILKEWLTEKLQRPITWETGEFGNLMKNGYLVAGVLLSYNIITDEQYFLISVDNAPEDVKNNWKYLKQWLTQIDVNLTNSEHKQIMEGKSPAILRMFYQMFLHLDKRDRINFIKRERKLVSNLVEKLSHRFEVEKVKEVNEIEIDNLSKPLLNENHYIEWQRKKADEIKDTYDYVRHKYSKMIKRIEETRTAQKYYKPPPIKLEPKDRGDMEKFSLKYPNRDKNFTFEQLLKLDQKAAEYKKGILDSEWAKNYMDNLSSRLRKKCDSEEFQKQITNVISGTLWDSAVAEEETKSDMELAKKVMKLSQFEKQMCTQLMETKQQARNLSNNRVKAEREFVEERDHQFNIFLDNLKDQINSEVVEIDFERKRQNTLHKRLYAEKMKRKRQHYYEICHDTVLSLIDYANKYAYYRRLIGGDIPKHFIREWKNLYFKHQPIFEVLDPMEDILKEGETEEELAPEVEEILQVELGRQDALNDKEFEEYHNYLQPWSLETLIPNFDQESEERKIEYLGNRILGHVVYTLLEIKYPFPPQRQPANLPNYKIKALLRGLPEKGITSAIQTLLNLRKIHVVRVETAINFCLRKYKAEMIGSTDIELPFDKFIGMAQQEDDKELLRLVKSEDETTYKNSDANVSAVSSLMGPNNKITQTPKTIPEEDISLSAAAELGNYAYEALSNGESLTDHLLSAIIIEYIRDQEDINGFVIINYPNSYREAKILEETFSGESPPDEPELNVDKDDIYLEESIVKHRKKRKDTFEEVRISKLVHNPHKIKIEKPFESYFTTYIRLVETEDILQEFVIWDLTESNSELIDRFYAALGLNYSMYYETIDKEFLAQICKYIIGDFAIPIKTFSKLFGAEVLSGLDFPSSEDKRTKSKIIKPETFASKLKHGSKGSKSSAEQEEGDMPSTAHIEGDSTVFIAEDMGEEDEKISKTDQTESVEEPNILAGEEDWDYGVLPINESIGIALANCWEHIEKGYIHDIQQLFLAKRLQMNTVIPYTRFLKDKMEQIITMPSRKQELVVKFQKDYNDFEDDWRDINAVKSEWHCRIKELQDQLYTICDERKVHSEKQRQALICENWTVEELTTMVNTYICCMQAEINRSMLSFQALHDFYFTMIKKLPPNERITSKDLVKINRETEDAAGVKKGEDKVFRQIKSAFQDFQLKNIEIDYSNNPFNLLIENNVKLAHKIIREINDHYRTLIIREYSEVAKIVPTVKKKDDSELEETENPEEVFRRNALKCIDEWIMGINGEMFRAMLRVQALQYKCYSDMKLFSDQIYNTFNEIKVSINEYYTNEIISVDRLCKYLQMAVENSKKVPETLILENDTFIIDPNLLQFEETDTSPKVDESKEVVCEWEFKVHQLARLRDQFKIVAPTGIALQQAFVYLVQDFLYFGKESCEGPLFPEIWKRLDPEQIPKLVDILYGETPFIDWRDFLIYALNIRYPTVDELLETRKKLRCKDENSTELISREDFINKKLWFESDFDLDVSQAKLRLNLIKHFLFELYESAENFMNYSAFLLAFCKNSNPVEGFLTALSMAVGKKTCSSWDECQEVVCKLIEDKRYRDACIACAHKCIEEFTEKLINKVVDTCEGTIITEIAFEETVEEKSKVKKGKGGKGKKLEASSARSKTSQKGLSNKQSSAQSTVDVKTTYICKPCEDVAPTEEKKVEEEKPKEEPKPVPIADPELAYAVNRNVVWNILRICLPGHFQFMPDQKPTPYMEYITEILDRLSQDTYSGDVFVCKLINEPQLCKLLHKVKKFTALNLAEEINKLVPALI